MTGQLVDRDDLIFAGFTRPELMTLLAAATREERRLHRANGARPATLGRVVEYLGRLAAAADMGADMSPRRPQPRSGHADTPTVRTAPASPTSRRNGSMRQLTTSEAAAHLGLSPRHVRRLVDQGLLEGAAVDGRGKYAIDEVSVAAWALQRTTRRTPHGLDAPGPAGAAG